MATVHERKIQIARDKTAIAGTLVTPGALIPGVLFVHGWGGSQQQYLARSREVASLGSVCLAFDLGGHAATLGQREVVSRSSNLADVLAAYDALLMHPQVDPARVAVIGSSYGGYLAAILTTLRPVHWLALRAPAIYPDAGWDVPKLQLHRDNDLPAYRSAVVATASNCALRACSRFEGDVLIVESERDDRIPRAVINSYRESCTAARSLTYRTLRGADHGLTTEANQHAYTTVLVQWLNEMWPDARRGSDSAAVAEAISDAAAQSTAADREPEAPPKVVA
jgi:dienelactone hydrolase